LVFSWNVLKNFMNTQNEFFDEACIMIGMGCAHMKAEGISNQEIITTLRNLKSAISQLIAEELTEDES